MKYMILVKGDERTEAGELPHSDLVDAMAVFHEKLHEAGVLVAAEGLKSTAEGFRVQYEGNERVLVDGPFTESKEIVAGFTMIDVPSRKQAIDWAMRFPNPKGEGISGHIEVRRIFELDDFEPSEGVERFREMERKF